MTLSGYLHEMSAKCKDGGTTRGWGYHKNENAPCFQCKQQRNRFEAIVASIDKVSLGKDKSFLFRDIMRQPTCHEDIARLWYTPSLPQQLQQIPKLAVDVTADGYWTGHGLDIGFFHEDAPHAVAQGLHL